ncbi:DUF6153 family protein [Leucobacter sp. HNU]|uniref:DUF6153 family protein n=1 Tax=Leucobacter sp. HNU TaxID=3236805 RepID=UPI003A80EB47
MNQRQTVKRTHLGAHGLLLTAMAVFFVIAGLLGMHTLSSDHTMGLPAVAPESQPHMMTAEEADTPATDVLASIATDAGVIGATVEATHSPMQHDPMLMTMCILALLSGAVILLLPVFLTLFRAMRPLVMLRLHAAFSVLPLPRPPSLHVLSISRT